MSDKRLDMDMTTRQARDPRAGPPGRCPAALARCQRDVPGAGLRPTVNAWRSGLLFGQGRPPFTAQYLFNKNKPEEGTRRGYFRGEMAGAPCRTTAARAMR